MQLDRGDSSESQIEPVGAALIGVFADLRAIARLLQMRARELEQDDAEDIGYLAQLVEVHAEQGLARITGRAGKKGSAT